MARKPEIDGAKTVETPHHGGFGGTAASVGATFGAAIKLIYESVRHPNTAKEIVFHDSRHIDVVNVTQASEETSTHTA